MAIGALFSVVLVASPSLGAVPEGPDGGRRLSLDLGELHLDARLLERAERLAPDAGTASLLDRIDRGLARWATAPPDLPAAVLFVPAPPGGDGGRPLDEAAGLPPALRPPRGPNHFELDVGGARSAFSHGDGRNEAALAIGDRIIAHGSYLRPGTANDFVFPGQWTEVAARALLDGDKATGLGLHAHAVMWGRYLRRFERRGPSEIAGWGLLVGVGPAFDYDSRVLPDVRDRTVSAGLIGPMLELDRRHGKAAMHASVAARYGLGVVQAMAQPGAADVTSEAFAPPGSPPTLRGEGAYYAQGLISGATLSLRWQQLEMVVAGRLDAFWSLDGRGRLQQMEPPADFSLSDQRASLRTSFSIRPWQGPLRLVTGVERVVRRGQLLDSVVESRETRASVSAAMAF